MCDAYENIGIKAKLIVSNNGDQSLLRNQNLYDFYYVDNHFKIKQLKVNYFSKWRKLFSLAFKFPFIAIRDDFSFCHSRSLITAYVIAKFFKKHTVFELHDAVWHNPRSKKIFLKLLNLNKLKFLIVITHALAKDVEKLNISKIPILVAPDGVSEKSLSSTIDRDFARRYLGLSIKEYIIVYSGHLYKGRGIKLIISLAKVLKEIKFLIVGGNKNDITFYSLQVVGLSNIQFLGHQNQETLHYFLLSADILLMPYERSIKVAGENSTDTSKYASPLKMFEYMATGRPIISSDLPVLQEVLKNFKNSIILPYEDLIAWKNAILLLKNKPELAKKLARKAKEDVKEFIWEKRASKIVNFYNKLNEPK